MTEIWKQYYNRTNTKPNKIVENYFAKNADKSQQTMLDLGAGMGVIPDFY